MLQWGDTALHWAAARGYVEVINLLVKHGAAVDIRNKVEPCNIYCIDRAHAHQRWDKKSIDCVDRE
jgi:ankyrin repeat protein